MTGSSARYSAPVQARAAAGWTLQRITPPSRLYGANGLRTGADGRLYVAQVVGSQISAIDPNTGAIEVISPMGGEIVGPDDLAFDSAGNLFITEFTEGRVSMLTPDGRATVIHGDMPGANPITVHRGRIFAGECRPGARLMELDRSGGAPHILLEDIPMANAMEVGPDGKLYFPVMGLNEIWRIDLDGGQPEKVAGDLGVPDSVKFDAAGFIISTQVASGQVLRIDPRNGSREVLADISPGLDNVTLLGDRIFVSSFTGQITEILAGGGTTPLIPDGFNWPMGMAVADDGMLHVTDGGFFYALTPDGGRSVQGMLMTPGFPGYFRSVAISGAGEFVVATAAGAVARYRPSACESEIIAEGLSEPNGLALGPAGEIVVAEGGTGRLVAVESGSVRVLATGLDKPMGVAIDAGGTCYVSETGAGRVVALRGGKMDVVLDGLGAPHGIALVGMKLFVVDVGTKTLVQLDLETGGVAVIASDLPVGVPPGIMPKALRAIPPHSGPMGPFADIAAAPDGTLYLSADAEGSVIALRPLTARQKISN